MNHGRAVLAIVIACSGTASAQKISIDAALRASDRSYVEATGESTISVKPDQAVIHIGVITQASAAADVAAQNARQTDGVLAELRKLLLAGDRVRTTNYSVQPNYQIPKAGTAAKIDGYRATNVIEVTLDDLVQVGKVVDAVLASGANYIQNVQFGLKNPQAAHARALKEAAARARASAEAIAAGLGAHFVRVLSAEEYTGEEMGMQKKMPMSIPGATPTQIVANAIEVGAIVLLKAEIAP